MFEGFELERIELPEATLRVRVAKESRFCCCMGILAPTQPGTG